MGGKRKIRGSFCHGFARAVHRSEKNVEIRRKGRSLVDSQKGRHFAFGCLSFPGGGSGEHSQDPQRIFCDHAGSIGINRTCRDRAGVILRCSLCFAHKLFPPKKTADPIISDAQRVT